MGLKRRRLASRSAIKTVAAKTRSRDKFRASPKCREEFGFQPRINGFLSKD
jgi:hypothetical protein